MCLCVLSLVVVPGPSPGASEPSEADCAKAVSTPEIVACAAKELTRADAELNAIYRQAIAHIRSADHLSASQRRQWERALRLAQQNWSAFRDQDCGEPVGWEWFQGTGMGTASLACKIGKTRTRAEELKGRYGSG